MITYAKRLLLIGLMLALAACTKFNPFVQSETKPEQLKVKVLARSVANLFGDERLQRRFCLADHRL